MENYAVTALYAGVLGLWFVFLSLRVSLVRIRQGTSRGDGGDATLQKAIRLQGNAAEYLPLALILIALCEVAGVAPAVLHGLGLAVVIGRGLHFAGFGATPQRPRLRQVGMVLTYGALSLASVVLLFQAIAAS